MSGMFWIALELSIPKIGLNIMLSLTVKELNAFKFDGVAESDNTVSDLIYSYLWNSDLFQITDRTLNNVEMKALRFDSLRF